MNGVRLVLEQGHVEAWSGLARPNVFWKVMFRAMMDDDVGIELLLKFVAQFFPPLLCRPS